MTIENFDYDLIVIGAGSGGVAAARRASLYGAKVLAIEKDRVGGTCVIRGCVPKKLLMYAASYRGDFEDALAYGWSFEGLQTHDWATLIAAKDKEIDRLNQIYISMLEKGKIDLKYGNASIIAPHLVQVEDQTYSAKHILIATGAHPFIPDIEGHEHLVSSDQIFHLKTLPQKIIIIGGGYIAVEFACILNGLGADVSIMIRRNRILDGFDHDLREKLMIVMKERGIKFICHENPTKITKHADSFEIISEEGNRYEADLIMAATGRIPDTASLFSLDLKVDLDNKGAIKVNEYSATSIPSIYAVGDVTNRMALTPVAIREGRFVAENLFNNQDHKLDYHNIATAIFAIPPMSSCGMSEEQALDHYGKEAIKIYHTEFRPLKNTLSGRHEKIFMKLITYGTQEKVIGIHMLGFDAPEIMQSLAVAVKAGATKQDFNDTIPLHPTTAEEFMLLH